MRIAGGESIFARMTALAQRHGALNLAQGLMWLPPDPTLLEVAAEVFSDFTPHQYTLPAGSPSLREVLAHLSERFFGTPYDPAAEVTITAGATEAIFAAVQALTQPGDEAVFIEPAYDSYLPAFQIGGIQAHPVALTITPEGISLDWEAVAAAITSRTRLLLLNFPHNPTGRVLHPEDIVFLEGLLTQYPFLHIIVDEAYEYMYWLPDPEEEQATAPRSVRQSPFLRSRSVIIGSLGKVLGVTGWRLGYVLAPPALSHRIRTVHQFITFCAPSPLQEVAARYLGAHPDRVFYFHQALLARRRQLVSLLRAHTGLTVLPPEGGYFVLVRPPNSTLPDTILAEELTRLAKVATIPLSPFYRDGTDPGWLRLCFARPVEMLMEAARQLSQVYPAALSSAHPNE